MGRLVLILKKGRSIELLRQDNTLIGKISLREKDSIKYAGLEFEMSPDIKIIRSDAKVKL